MATGSTTTITLNKGFANKLKKSGVKVQKVSPGTVKGNVITLPVLEGSLDPATGQGTLTHEGGIKFKKGSKNVTLKELVLETATSSLNAKVGSKKMKLATVGTLVNTRTGFGTTVAISSMKLTSKAAKELNKKLGFSSKPKKNKKQSKRASTSKKKAASAPFKANQNLGGSSSAVQPKTVAIKAGGTANLVTSETTVKKLALAPPEGLAVKIEPIAPTVIETLTNPFTPVLKFPLTGGTIAPNGTSGTVQTTGGVKLVQDLGGEPGEARTTITLGNIWVDMATKKATAEVVVESNIDPQLNLGSFGRTSIADVVSATVKTDETARTVTVENAVANLQETTAEVLNKVFGAPFDAMKVPHPTFSAADGLGVFSFTAQGE